MDAMRGDTSVHAFIVSTQALLPSLSMRMHTCMHAYIHTYNTFLYITLCYVTLHYMCVYIYMCTYIHIHTCESVLQAAPDAPYPVTNNT